MKKISLLLLSMLFLACDKDELNMNNLSETDSDIVLDCSFNLKNLQPNNDIIIDCLLDLNGETITLPNNITLKHQGEGKIFNGNLVFDTGKIDGELLNIDLKIEGNVELSNSEFFFTPEKWDITEGETSIEIALKNKNNLQSAIDLTKKLKADTFTIDKLDAYFETVRDKWANPLETSELAIHLPSDFHLIMTENTFLRVQPSYWPRGHLLSVYIKKNVKVTGGNLIGDRFEHDYTDIIDEAGISRGTHEFSSLIYVAGSKDVVVKDVKMKNSTGDGFGFGASAGFRFMPGNPFNKNISLIGCTIDASRRNNISVLDGEDLFITKCTIINAGDIKEKEGSNGWLGTNPRVGIDIEPFRGRKPDLSDAFEIVENTQIKDCTFKNNQVASIIEFSGNNTKMEGNTSDFGFFASFSTGSKFINNTFIGNEKAKRSVAITTGDLVVDINGVDTQLSTENVVRGNTVKGFNVGVEARGNNGLVEDNNLEILLYGIQVKKASRYNFKNNIVTSMSQNSIGLSIANSFAENITFTNENYTNPRKAVEFFNVNTETPYNTSSIIFDDCKFNSIEGFDMFFKNTPNVTVKNSQLINTKIKTVDCLNFKDINNTILP